MASRQRKWPTNSPMVPAVTEMVGPGEAGGQPTSCMVSMMHHPGTCASFLDYR